MKVFGILAAANPSGLTAQLFQNVLKGAETNGAEIETITLTAEMLVMSPKEVRSLGQKLKKSDCFVIATPTYWSSMSGLLKQFFDIMRDYFVHTTSDGRIIPYLLKGKTYVTITSCYKSRFENLFGGVTNQTFNEIDDILAKAGMHRTGELVLTNTFNITELPAKKRLEANRLGENILKKSERGGFTLKRYLQLFGMLAVSVLIVMGIQEGLKALGWIPKSGFFTQYIVFVLLFFAFLSIMLRAVTLYNHKRG